MKSSNYWSRVARKPASRRRFLAGSTSAVAGLASMSLAGCGGDDDDSSDGPTSPAQAGDRPSDAVATTVSEPVRGGVLQLSSSVDMSYDPIVDSTSAASIFGGTIYSRLVRYIPGTDLERALSAEVTGDAASSWEQPDTLTFTFKINPEAKFHNLPPVNGRALTADDVVQSYKRTTSETKNTNKDKLLAVIDGDPVAVDERTVRVKTKKPFSPFLGGLVANPQFWFIYPKELLADDSLRTSNPVGSGPWMFKKATKSVAWEFEKNPNSWWKDAQGRQLPYADGWKRNTIPDASQTLAQFIGGNLDHTAINYQDIDQVKSQVKGAQVVNSSAGAFYFISPQQRTERGGPWLDVRMRKALSLAMDRQGILDLFWGGNGKFYGITSPNLGSWSKDMRESAQKATFTRNLTEAKALMSAAGYNDEPLRYIYSNNAYGDQFNQIAVFTADKLKEAGFNVQVVTQDYRGEYITPGKTFFGNYDGMWIGTEASFTDPYYILYNMLYTGNSWNHAGISDPAADRLIDELGSEFDRAKRIAIIEKIEAINAENMYYVPAATGDGYTAVQPWVNNFQLGAGITYGHAQEIYASEWIDRS